MTSVQQPASEQVFGPFRPVGIVCGDLPAAATTLYGEPMLLVPVRRTFQLYKGENLALVRGGPEFEHDVTCVAQSGKFRYAAEGALIHAFSQHKPLWTVAHNATLRVPVLHMHAVDELLFSFGADGRCVVFEARPTSNNNDGASNAKRRPRAAAQSNDETDDDADAASKHDRPEGTTAPLYTFPLQLGKGVTPTCAVVPPHFESKVLVGATDGSLRLYNFRTGKLLFTFQAPCRDNSDAGSAGHPGITALCASPYQGIVAIGLRDGRALVYHFVQNTILATFTHNDDPAANDVTEPTGRGEERGLATKRHRAASSAASLVANLRVANAGSEPAAITALTFRNDNQCQTLVTATALGSIAFWDLKERLLLGVLSGSRQVKGFDELVDRPHQGAVHTLFCVTGTGGKPLLVAGGADNALTQYRLDTVDGLALMIRDRRGHTGPCSAAQFYNGELLVTAGEDRRVRVTHVFSDRASWEMSQGKLGKRAKLNGVSRDDLRLPPATQLACMPARNYQWASIVTIHDCCAKLCGWRLDTRALAHKTEPIRTTAHACTAVSLSQCGNFAVVGYSSGHVVRVNLQDESLLHFYSAGRGSDRAHPEGGRVTGVEVFQWCDLVATAAADATVRLWRLTTGRPLTTLQLPSAVTSLCPHRSSMLLCAGCEDYSIRVVSLTDGRLKSAEVTAAETRGSSQTASATIARTLQGHRAPVTAVALAPDSQRHLVSAAGDGSLLVWDLSAAQCVAQYRLPAPATSLCFHPDALFLATTHAGEPGVYLWTNRLRYGLAPEAIDPLATPLSQAPLMHFPKQEVDVSALGAAAEGAEENKDTDRTPNKPSKAPLPPATAATSTTEHARDSKGLVQITAFGSDYWSSLSQLDRIRERNEPLQPPKKASVPFFLPTTSELKATFVVKSKQGPSTSSSSTANSFAHFTAEAGRSEFASMLIAEDYDGLLKWMEGASPSLIDLRIKSIVKPDEEDDETGVVFEQNERALQALLQFVAYAIRTLRAFDMVQALVHMLFTVHGETIANHQELLPRVEAVKAAQVAARERIHIIYGRVNCLTSTFANAYA